MGGNEMARNYYLEVKASPTDGDDPGVGSGMRIDDVAHMSDDAIEVYVKSQTDSIRWALRSIRKTEQEREREKARPFWEKWLGA